MLDAVNYFIIQFSGRRQGLCRIAGGEASAQPLARPLDLPDPTCSMLHEAKDRKMIIPVGPLKRLRPFPTNPLGELDISLHDRRAVRVDGAEIRVFEQPNQICFRRFL
jgi:hypothetical protein